VTGSAPTMTWREVLSCRPCAPARESAAAKLREAFADCAERRFTLADAESAGVHFDEHAASRSRDCARRARLFSADCAARVYGIADDPRSAAAIVAARQLATEKIGRTEASEIRLAAWIAGREVHGGPGHERRCRARDAAAWSLLDSDGPHDAAKYARSAICSVVERNAEATWQRARLVARFSADEPEDWRLSNVQGKP
jgi:hypothetical protein